MRRPLIDASSSQPRKPIDLDDIEPDYIRKADDIYEIARYRQPTLRLVRTLGKAEDLDRKRLHLLITADIK